MATVIEFNFDLWVTGDYWVYLRDGRQVEQMVYDVRKYPMCPIYVRVRKAGVLRGSYYRLNGKWFGSHEKKNYDRDLMLQKHE